MIEIQQYNPYPSFQSGQAEAINQILDLREMGQKVVELNAPTAAGKSLDLFVLGRVLAEELQVGRVVYTTPLVALVNQLQETKAFEKMPVLKGKRNYPCQVLREATGGWQSADDCPFETWRDAIGKNPACGMCEYHKAYAKFMARDFGATTLARYQMGGAVHDETTVLLVDESAGIEKTLIDRATLTLVERIDLEDLVPSLTLYYHDLEKEAAELDTKIDGAGDDWGRIAQLMKAKNFAEREARKTAKVLGHIEKQHPYIIDKERRFRLLDGRSEFRDLVEHLDLCVLASGTPATSIITDDYKPVIIQHPIPVEKRLCYYRPVGSMNFKERQQTAPKMAAAIADLHQKFGKKTMVHCGAYVIARMLHDNMPSSVRKYCILQDQKEREGSKNKFLAARQAIFLSVNFEEGLDLKGPDYPLNIIAKVPFENIGDEFVKARNERDNYKRYNMHAAVAVMQAAGRCTRSVDDFSETYILDSSWQGFFNRSRKLFQPWFVAALRKPTEMSLEAWAQ